MKREFCHRQWNIVPFGAPAPGAPLVLLFTGEEEIADGLGAALTAACVPSLWLAFPLAVDWDRDYTPWPAEGTGGRVFAGRADELLMSAAALRGALRNELRPGSVYPVGYSLGGLAALYFHARSPFDGAGSCSGSLWYPGWTDYLAAHPPTGKVYLSLGGKEKNTRDIRMRQNPDATVLTLRICARSAQKATFRSESGGHFKDPSGRVARAVAWLCKDQKTMPPAPDRDHDAAGL